MASMNSSLILRDTMGPVKFYGNNDADKSSLQSSATSSKEELSYAEENGLRTTLRVIPGDDVQPSTSVRDVHLIGVHGDVDRGTPDSTASSTARFFRPANGVIRDFQIGGLQNPGYGQTTREAIRKATDTDNLGWDQQDEMPSVQQSYTADPQGSPTKKQEFYEKETKKESRNCMLPKCALLGMVVLVLVAGIVLLVYFKKEAQPDAIKGQVVQNPEDPNDEGECPEVVVNLRKPIGIRCYIEDTIAPAPVSLRIVAPVYVNEGKSIFVDLTSKDTVADWNATYRSNMLNMNGPEATCSSSGSYHLQFLDIHNITLYNTSVQITVKSEILKVNVSLTQSISDDNTDQTDFTIGCSTNSGCEQSFVEFFAEINKEEQYLRGVNFSCVITYNDYDGYSVSCVGNIPDYLMSQFGKITCRPKSRLLDDYKPEDIDDLEVVLELPECDVSQHCGYKCTAEGDYYVVNAGRCDIFHRCYNEVVYTSYCAPGTFFDPTMCTCRHTAELKWCQPNGAVKPNTEASHHNCTTDQR